MDDEDAPPELVDVTAYPETQKEGLQEAVVNRVPITLVTGKAGTTLSLPCSIRTTNNICSSSRILGRWENDSAQLYTHGETWQENCCDYEWFVARLCQS